MKFNLKYIMSWSVKENVRKPAHLQDNLMIRVIRRNFYSQSCERGLVRRSGTYITLMKLYAPEKVNILSTFISAVLLLFTKFVSLSVT